MAQQSGRSASVNASERFARRLGLRLVTVDELTIARRRRGRGFAYFCQDGSVVSNPELIERFNRLAVPPAYVDALYCADERGHLQAMWRDAAGRLQYRYHPDWEKVREDRRLRRLARLSRALSRIRRAVTRRLSERQPSREFAVAAVVELTAATGIRAGRETYARAHGTRGAATLLKTDVVVRGARVTLSFSGKGGKPIRKQIHAPRLVDAFRILRSLPGQRLFQYCDPSGETRAVRAREVNEFLREAAGMAVSLKDFRTLTASTAALEALAQMSPAQSKRQQRRQVLEAMRAAAGELSNTPAVCRKSYVPAKLVAAFEDGSLQNIVAHARRNSRSERLLAELLGVTAPARP